MDTKTRRDIFGYGKAILEARIDRKPTQEELLIFLRSAAAELNPEGGESLSALSQRQANRLAATLRGDATGLIRMRSDTRRRKHRRIGADSPWASDEQKKFYTDLCAWAGWSEARREGFLKHMTKVDSLQFMLPSNALTQCIEGVMAIIARESGSDKDEVRRRFYADTDHGWLKGAEK